MSGFPEKIASVSKRPVIATFFECVKVIPYPMLDCAEPAFFAHKGTACVLNLAINACIELS